MFTDTINKCAANAARIARLSANNPLGDGRDLWYRLNAGDYRRF